MAKNMEIQQPLRDEISLSKVLHALSDPVRMVIILKIARAGQVACGAFDIPMPKSTLSHHFKVLRESGVVASRREGNALINSVRFDDLEARFPGVIGAIIAAADRVLPALTPVSNRPVEI
jgi:DNA-binding transcriptional ArsR family regulator